MIAIVLVVGSFLTSAGLTAAVRKMSLRLDFVSRPKAGRYHRSVIPLGGGIAIFTTLAAFLIGSIIVVKLGWLGGDVAVHTEGFITKIPKLIILIGCMGSLFAIGLIDDKTHLGPGLKLFLQFAVAIAAAVFANIRVEFFIHNQFITTAMSVIWIVLILNVFNFLDNMDGASAGIATIAVSILFVANVIAGQVFVGALSLVFIGTSLGFLVFNFPPARIFMGDAGSLVIGFTLAVLSLRTTYYKQAISGEWYPVLLPILAMAVPLYDFVTVTFLRISQGKSPFIGDTQHFSHRLKRHGLNDRQTVLTLYLATFATGLGATFLYQVNLAGAIAIMIQTLLVLAIIAIFESTVKNDL